MCDAERTRACHVFVESQSHRKSSPGIHSSARIPLPRLTSVRLVVRAVLRIARLSSCNPSASTSASTRLAAERAKTLASAYLKKSGEKKVVRKDHREVHDDPEAEVDPNVALVSSASPRAEFSLSCCQNVLGTGTAPQRRTD